MCTNKKCTFLYTDLPPDGTKIPSEYDTILFRESLLHLGRAHIRYGLCVVGHSGLFWQTCKTSLHSFLFYHIFICGKKRSYYLPNITIKIIIVLLQDIIRKHNLFFNTCSTTVATTQPKKRPRGFVILVSHVVEERPQEAEVITI